MPRVLRIINRLNLGGPTYNAAYLTKYLEPEFETLLLSGMKDEAEASSEFIVRNLDLHPVYLPEMYRELNPFKDYKSYYKLRKLIEEFKPDIVHTHAAKAGAVGRLAAIHSGVPIILHTFHGHVFHSYFNAVKTQMFLQIERYLAKRTTKIIALSELQLHELSEVYQVAPREKFTIIPLGFDLHRFWENQEEKRKNFRDEYGLEEDEVAVGIVGRLVPVKNHNLFLEAAREVLGRTNKKVRFFVIGDGEKRQEIEEKAKLLGINFDLTNTKLSAPLVFTGWQREIDVCNAGLDIIALTSFNEGTPVSLIEAQASGRPIVSTRVGGIENIVIEKRTALLSEINDKETFAAHMLSLVEDPEKRKRMSAEGKDHVKARFSYQRLCGDMAELYRQLLCDKNQ